MHAPKCARTVLVSSPGQAALPVQQLWNINSSTIRTRQLASLQAACHDGAEVHFYEQLREQ